MIKVHVTDDWGSGGIKIFVIQQNERDRLLLRFHDDGFPEWVRSSEPGLEPQPTITLNDDEGRALLEALVRYYQGAEDTRSLRKDYDAERARVDKFIQYLLTERRS